MNTLIRKFFTSIILLAFLSNGNAQGPGSIIKKTFIFSTIKGSDSKVDSFTLPVNVKAVHWISGDTSAFHFILNNSHKNNSALFQHTLDRITYYVGAKWNKNASVKERSLHYFIIAGAF